MKRNIYTNINIRKNLKKIALISASVITVTMSTFAISAISTAGAVSAASNSANDSTEISHTKATNATSATQSYNLYSSNSTKSKIIGRITHNNQNNYIRFYTNKNNTWSKYADTKTGTVGWINTQEVNKVKLQSLKKEIIKRIDKQLEFYQDKLTELNKFKVKVNNSTYKELKNYHPSVSFVEFSWSSNT